jgi:hypothetical protein
MIIEFALKLGAANVKPSGGERQGVPSAPLGPLRVAPVKGFRVIDPTGQRRGPCNAE